MAVRVKKHGGDHTWRLKSAWGACGSCLMATGKVLPLKMKWECTVEGCKGKKTSRHAHVV